MNRTSVLLLCATCVAGVSVSCSQANPTPVTGTSTGGSTSALGGATGAGGSVVSALGGASTSGGASTLAGGTTAAGGASLSGGGTGAGGGATTSGGSTAAGGSPAAGGATTSGGATGLGGATGGGGTSGAGSVTPQSIVPTLDGFLWVGDCANANGNQKDCPILNDTGTSCITSTDFYAEGAFKIHQHTVGGTAGAKYMINLEARGVTGGKSYNGGTRQSTATAIDQTANDGWYVGGLPTNSKWNTYEVHVSPPVPGQPVNTQALTCTGCPTPPDNVYYTNAIVGGADGLHETFPIKFSASFPVLGGGTITLIIHDSNCLGQQNCGSNPDAAAMCTDPRTIDLSGMAAQPPAGFVQPVTNPHTPNPWYPQWLFLDVKSVTQQ